LKSPTQKGLMARKVYYKKNPKTNLQNCKITDYWSINWNLKNPLIGAGWGQLRHYKSLNVTCE
jgi:hypothetical protein